MYSDRDNFRAGRCGRGRRNRTQWIYRLDYFTFKRKKNNSDGMVDMRYHAASVTVTCDGTWGCEGVRGKFYFKAANISTPQGIIGNPFWYPLSIYRVEFKLSCFAAVERLSLEKQRQGLHSPEAGIYKRKQESKKTRKKEKRNSTKKAIKKTRKQELAQESDQEKRKKKSFFLMTFLVYFFVFLFLLSCFLL